MPLRIRRTVTVKAVVTEELRGRLGAELQAALAGLEAELRRLAGAGNDPAEQARRQQQKEQVLGRMKELARLELGSEIVQGTVEGEVEVRLGDEWPRLFSAEIVLRDGRVIALRE